MPRKVISYLDEKWQQLVPRCKLPFISIKILTDFEGKNVLYFLDKIGITTIVFSRALLSFTSLCFLCALDQPNAFWTILLLTKPLYTAK